VSAEWVLDCWTANTLLDTTTHPPTFKPTTLDNQLAKTKTETDVTTKPSLMLFKGSVFCLVRVATPEDAVDFDQADLEQTIRSHGGQLLSHKLLDALQVDARNTQTTKRKLYAVCWGAYNTSHLDLHPLLSQVKRNDLCNLISVTPIWLSTCLAEVKVMSPQHMPSILSPREFPWCALGPIHISISGYSGSKRTALCHFIQAVAIYDDAMARGQTTHLIVKQAKGDKYEKAKEWGVHVVSIEWLLHVVQYGMGGAPAHGQALTKQAGGCEHRFPPPPAAV
jgi:hypothetical protein